MFNKQKIREEIIKSSGLNEIRILNITLFGSKVYGNASVHSDWDVLIIANTPSPEVEIKDPKFNIHILSEDRFREGLKQHHIRALECIMSPDWAKIQENIKFDDFKLNMASLRHSISHINSNSWVKAKKKLAQGDYYIGIKSLWHALRIVMFGSQIARWGYIKDWDCANYIWDELTFKDQPQYMRNKKQWTWEELDAKYRTLNNELLSGFRLFAPKL